MTEESKVIFKPTKFAVGISPDAMEFGMTHGMFDYELEALEINPSVDIVFTEEQKGWMTYIVGYEELITTDGSGDRPDAFMLMHEWDIQKEEWKRIWPSVVHCKTFIGPFTYIGRGSKWGNPFKIGPHGTRNEVINKYAEWLLTQDDLLGSLEELRGQNLGCYCAPEACHGDILLKLANEPLPMPEKSEKDIYSVISEEEREKINWNFSKYFPDDEDLLIRTNEWEKYNNLTRDGVGRDNIGIFNAAFIRGLAWGLFKAGTIIADGARKMNYMPDLDLDDDIPF